MFVNMSNHPLSTWTADQLAAVRGLELGEPVELDGEMPLAPAEADEGEIGSLAAGVAERAVAQGATGAFVATDMTFTFALVRELNNRNVPCFAATTRRVVEETPLPDGGTEKRSVFQFVRWREYR